MDRREPEAHRVPLTVVIPAANEELNLPRCLASVSEWVDEIVVIDSGSDDRTCSIAADSGARVVEHAYSNAPSQWSWALTELEIRNEWILALDADWAVSAELKREVQARLAADGAIAGYYVRHRQMFRGRFIRHGGIYPRYRLCLFKRSAVHVDDHDRVDNRFFVNGRSATIEADVIEDNRKESDFGFWMMKQLRYAESAAEEEVGRKFAGSTRSFGKGRNERVVKLKRRWSRLPLYWRSIGYFLYRYVLRLGFLDGKEGFLYHFSQALVFRIALDARVEELRSEQI